MTEKRGGIGREDGIGSRALAALAQKNAPVVIVFALCIVRIWLMPLPSSFWGDETATVFVVRHGAAHPSFAVAPQLPASLYYWLPRAADRLFGISEIGYRIPSVLAIGLALWFVARISSRLIHPAAGWFAAIACLGLHPINYYAVDARPYALGIFMAAASVWFMVRWLDTAGWRDGLWFAALSGIVLWVHAIYWPFYVLLALYSIFRLWRKETPAGLGKAVAVFSIIGLILLPVFVRAISLYSEAHKHVVTQLPSAKGLVHSLNLRLIVICGVAALLLWLVFRWRREKSGIAGSSYLLIAGWWLCQPVFLFLFSHATGNSVFINRYLSLSLPAVALASTVAVSFFLPKAYWKPATLALAIGILWMKSDWRQVWPDHDENWRGAAQAINRAIADSDSPVICISPFIEGRWPAWRPDYGLPGFLYSHLTAYPIRGQICPFPIDKSFEAEQYAENLIRTKIPMAGRFIVYGKKSEVPMWRAWFGGRPELAGWSGRSLGAFKGVEAVLFEHVPRPTARY